MLNQYRWFSVVVSDATQLAILLNEAETNGFEVYTILATPTGFMVALRVLLNTSNAYLLTQKDPFHAAKEVTPKTAVPERAALPVKAARAVAVGKSSRG
jgi:hypothetical protein